MPNFNNLCAVSGFNNNCLLNSMALGLLEEQGSSGLPYLLENEAFRHAFTTHYRLNQIDPSYVAPAEVIHARLQQCHGSFAKQDLLGPVLRSMLNGEAARRDEEALMLAFESFLIKMHEYFLTHDDRHDEADEADDAADFDRFQRYLMANENRGLARYMNKRDYTNLKNLYAIHRAANEDEHELTQHFVAHCKQNTALVQFFNTTLYQPYCDRIAQPNIMLEPVDVQVLLNTFNLKLNVYTRGEVDHSQYERQTPSDNPRMPITIEVKYVNRNHYEYYARSQKFKQSLAAQTSSDHSRREATPLSSTARITEILDNPLPIDLVDRNQVKTILTRKLREQSKIELTQENLEEVLNPSTTEHDSDPDPETKRLQEDFDTIFASHIERLQHSVTNHEKLDEIALDATLKEIGMRR